MDTQESEKSSGQPKHCLPCLSFLTLLLGTPGLGAGLSCWLWPTVANSAYLSGLLCR